MKTLSLRLSTVFASLALGAALAGCGGGGSSFTASPTPIPTATPAPGDIPYTQATFNLSVTRSSGSNYTGVQFRNTETGRLYDFFLEPGAAYGLTCSIPPVNTVQSTRTTSISVTLPKAVQEGQVIPVNASTREVYVSVSINPGGTTWSESIQGSSGQITVTKLSSTSVTLKVENVVLPAQPSLDLPGMPERPGEIVATGTVTLNGTITAQLPQ